MIKLTDRLQVLADQIEQKETMADIGTDHGFLPMALWERHICPKVIMSDVSPGSLEKARENAASLYPEEVFDLRLGNGIQVLQKGEVDAVVMAGMGGALMIRILSEDPEKTRSFKKLVLQPRNGQGKLRRWLLSNGFFITKESLVQEGKYICEVLTVSAPSEGPKVSEGSPFTGRHMLRPEAEDIEYEVPPWLLEAGDLAEELIQRRLAAEQRILSGLEKSKDCDKQRKEQVKRRISYLKSLLNHGKKVCEWR